MTEKNSNPFDTKEEADAKGDASENFAEMEFSFFDDAELNATEQEKNISGSSAHEKVASQTEEHGSLKDQDNLGDDFFSFDDLSASGQDFFSVIPKDDEIKLDDFTAEKESAPQKEGINEGDFSFFDPNPESSKDVFGESISENALQADDDAEKESESQNGISDDDFSFFGTSNASNPDVFSELSNEVVLQSDATAENDNTSESSFGSDGFSFFDAPPKVVNDNLSEDTDNDSSGIETSPGISREIAEPQANEAIQFEEMSVEKQPTASPNEESQESTSSADVPSPVIPQKMKFICEKCSAANEIDVALPAGDAYSFNCSSCSAGMKIIIESSILRALQKTLEKYCVKCSGRIDHHLFCPSCGLFCPNYYMHETSADIKRKTKAIKSVGLTKILARFKSLLVWRQDPSKKGMPQKEQKKIT